MPALTDLDRRILDRIQDNFPLCSHPYAALGEELGVSEEEVFERVCFLREQGIIRQLSANFWASKLGFVSTLCSAKVPSDALDSFLDVVNAIPNVTHNYLRDNPFNVWFTLICPSREDIQKTLDRVTQETGIEILNLPAEKIYKINVNFQMQDKNT